MGKTIPMIGISALSSLFLIAVYYMKGIQRRVISSLCPRAGYKVKVNHPDELHFEV